MLSGPMSSESRVRPLPLPLFGGLLGITLVLLGVSLWLIFFVAPTEARMGIAQKIFYFHVPSAYAMYIGFATAAIGSAGYLITRRPRWDAIAVAGAEVGMLFCSMVLLTGPLWARKAWGHFWTWDPRLTTVMLAALVFLAYLALRGFGDAGEVEKRFAAGLSLLALPLIPLINMSVQRWRGVHPTVITGRGGGLDPAMRPAFFVSLVAFTGFVILLLWLRTHLERLRQETRELEIDLARAGLLRDD